MALLFVVGVVFLIIGWTALSGATKQRIERGTLWVLAGFVVLAIVGAVFGVIGWVWDEFGWQILVPIFIGLGWLANKRQDKDQQQHVSAGNAAPEQTHCPVCSTPLPSEARFCGSCGAAARASRGGSSESPHGSPDDNAGPAKGWQSTTAGRNTRWRFDGVPIGRSGIRSGISPRQMKAIAVLGPLVLVGVVLATCLGNDEGDDSARSAATPGNLSTALLARQDLTRLGWSVEHEIPPEPGTGGKPGEIARSAVVFFRSRPAPAIIHSITLFEGSGSRREIERLKREGLDARGTGGGDAYYELGRALMAMPDLGDETARYVTTMDSGGVRGLFTAVAVRRGEAVTIVALATRPDVHFTVRDVRVWEQAVRLADERLAALVKHGAAQARSMGSTPLRIGDAVTSSAEACLNIRREPGMSTQVLRCEQRATFRAVIVDGPRTADGYRWWKLKDEHFGLPSEWTGWAREDLLVAAGHD